MPERTLVLCIQTYARPGGVSYLSQTLASLHRSGVFARGVPVHVIDGGSPTTAHLAVCADYPVTVHHGTPGQSRNLTGIQALEVGVASGQPWIVLLEDDVRLCGRFAESTYRWLGQHDTPQYPLYSLYAPFAAALWAYEEGRSCWRMEDYHFRGAQAVMLRTAVAARFVRYWPQTVWACCLWTAFDKFLVAAAKALYGVTELLCAAPCFVQHVGRRSALGNDRNFHESPSWQGEGWAYA